jgi:hypothetical protein
MDENRFSCGAVVGGGVLSGTDPVDHLFLLSLRADSYGDDLT